MKLIIKALCFLIAISIGAVAVAEDENKRFHKVALSKANQAELEGIYPGKGNVTVVEFYNLACGWCYRFEPMIEKWRATLPREVSFYRIPVVFDSAWEPLARAHYVLEALGAPNKVTQNLFQAIHDDKENLSTPETVVQAIAKEGFSHEQVQALFDGFSVEKSLTQAKTYSRVLQINSVPQLVVIGNGEAYTVSNTLPGGPPSGLPVVDEILHLIKNRH